MRSSGWIIVVFEGEHRQFEGEVAYVKGLFEQYEQATDWAHQAGDCPGPGGFKGEWQIAFLEAKE